MKIEKFFWLRAKARCEDFILIVIKFNCSYFSVEDSRSLLYIIYIILIIY